MLPALQQPKAELHRRGFDGAGRHAQAGALELLQQQRAGRDCVVTHTL